MGIKLLVDVSILNPKVNITLTLTSISKKTEHFFSCIFLIWNSVAVKVELTNVWNKSNPILKFTSVCLLGKSRAAHSHGGGLMSIFIYSDLIINTAVITTRWICDIKHNQGEIFNDGSLGITFAIGTDLWTPLIFMGLLPLRLNVFAMASLWPLNWFCWTSVLGPWQKTSCGLIDPDPRSLGENTCPTPPRDLPMRRLWKRCVTTLETHNGRVHGGDLVPPRSGFSAGTAVLATRKKCLWAGSWCSSSEVWRLRPGWDSL